MPKDRQKTDHTHYEMDIDTHRLRTLQLPPQNSEMLFLCYHGIGRSYSMAAHYTDLGFSPYFFSGGIQELQLQKRLGNHEEILSKLAMFQYIMVLLTAQEMGRESRAVLSTLTIKASEQEHKVYFVDKLSSFHRDVMGASRS